MEQLGELEIRRARAEDAGWLVARHAELYARDDGFDESFGPLVAQVLQRFFTAHDRNCEAGVIAERAGVPLGSIFVMREDAATARLRLFLLLPEARGQGLGQQLHDACLGFATKAGYRRIVLSTHESHKAACRLYARNGWKQVSRRPVVSFGQALVELGWEKNLQNEREVPLAPADREG